MSNHRVTLEWKRESADFTYKTYNRNHTWTFEGGTTIQASAAPDYLGSAELVNPEEAFVGALSACHMLTFLALAAKHRLVVESYEDEAVGTLAKNAQGKFAMTAVTLRPNIEFSHPPNAEKLAQLHKHAHEQCFIANSVSTQITIESP